MLASSYAVTMMVATRGVEVGICGFHLSVVVGTSTSSCARIMFYALTWVILCCSGNGDGPVKGTWSVKSTSLLDKDFTAADATFACSRSSCLMTCGDIYRIHTIIASIASSAMALITESRRRLSGSVPVTTTISKTYVYFVVKMLVNVEA